MAKTYNRIVSLVPSLTESLIDFGLADRLVGRTRFCVHPKEAVQDIPIVGGTKNPKIDTIKSLQPDLIVANREENRKQDITPLQKVCDVELTQIATVEDALLAMYQLGGQLGVAEKANDIAVRATELLNHIPDDEPPLRTAYFIWNKPWMTVGGDTYISDVMQRWGLQNVFGHQSRYPEFSLSDLHQRNPELVLLSSEPYPFKEKHLQTVQEAVPGARVLLVEGEWFSWYGSHMVHAFERLNVWRKAIA